eukprot:TRINITY_DN4420_c0_g1_i1.p1 TRINITY_DN4420_c0_g1~~TRINITY_DN4420_c0_g1_i1.p1  ORF type:complete len:107 (+),score=16.47 TRINITY_DN4420_c0_g1_i1:65-385(+)
MMGNARKKIESINRYNVEMNNLRTNIKTLQMRCKQTEIENDKLKESDSQSMLGSAAHWVSPRNWWMTKNKLIIFFVLFVVVECVLFLYFFLFFYYIILLFFVLFFV